MKRARHDGDEQDAFSRWGKKYLIWRPGQRKRVKRRANRRERREVNQDLRTDVFANAVADFAEQYGQPLTDWQRAVVWRVYRDTDSLGDLQADDNVRRC